MFFWNKKPHAPQPIKPERQEPTFSRVHRPTRGDRERAISKLQFVTVAMPKREDGTVATQDWSTPISGGCTMFGQTIPDSMLDWYGNQSFIGFQACMILAQHWLINAACEVPIIDALRKGHEFVSADGEKIDIKVLAQHNKFNKKLRLNQKITWFGKKARVFGIAIAVFKVESSDPLYYENPFNPDGITKGSYTGIALPDPYYCTPQMDMDGYDPASADFYEPEYWIISGKKYHKSHLVIFRHGGDLPSQLRPAYQWAGVSLVQQIYEAVYSAVQASNEANRLLMTKRLMVRKGDVGAAILDQVEFEEKMTFFQQVRDNYGEQIIDTTEDLLQLETALAEVTNVIAQKFEIVAAIARIPTNKLLMVALQGFASSGEGEEAIYNSSLETIQEQCLTEFLERHYELSIRSMGNAPFDFEIKWPAIDTITEKEQAEINQIKASTDQANLTSGAITGEDINKRLSADPNSGYDGIKYVEPEVDYSDDDDPRDGLNTTEDGAPIPAGASWITLEDGQHVLIGKDGKVIGGAGGALDGKYYGSHGENSPNKTITKNYNEEMAGKEKRPATFGDVYKTPDGKLVSMHGTPATGLGSESVGGHNIDTGLFEGHYKRSDLTLHSLREDYPGTVAEPTTPQKKEFDDKEKAFEAQQAKEKAAYDKKRQKQMDKIRAFNAEIKNKGLDKPSKPQDNKSYEITRFDRASNSSITETFSHGDYVSYGLAAGKSGSGEIEGISNAKKEVKVNGNWHSFGTVYKADKPEYSQPEKTPVSKVLESVNKNKGFGLTDDDRVDTSKPQDNVAQSTESSKMDSRSNKAGKPGETTMSATPPSINLNL